jgi:hypothetical protein
MKKVLFIMTIFCAVLFSCANNKAEKEHQDSIAAAAQADSMLKAEVAADSLKNSADSAKIDSKKAK